MKLEIKFPFKPRSEARKPLIDYVIGKGGIIQENGMISISFSNPKNSTFLKISRSVRGWRFSELLIDDKPFPLARVEQVSNCYLKYSCKGICLIQKYGKYGKDYDWEDNANNMISSIRLGNPWPRYCAKYFSFVKQISPVEFELNKTAMLAEIMTFYSDEHLFCEKYSAREIEKEISSLPNIFTAKVRSYACEQNWIDLDTKTGNLEPKTDGTPPKKKGEDKEGDRELSNIIDFSKLLAKELTPRIAKVIVGNNEFINAVSEALASSGRQSNQ